MKAYYEFRHIPGHGRSDHLAGLVLGRAAQHLGQDPDAEVRVPVARGAKARLRAAIRAAEQEVFGGRYADLLIRFVCLREGPDGPQIRFGRRWVRDEWAAR